MNWLGTMLWAAAVAGSLYALLTVIALAALRRIRWRIAGGLAAAVYAAVWTVMQHVPNAGALIGLAVFLPGAFIVYYRLLCQDLARAAALSAPARARRLRADARGPYRT